VGEVGTILWSFMSQRGCYEPALPIIDELLQRGHRVIGVTQAPHACPVPWHIEVVADRFLPPPAGLPAAAPGPPRDLEHALAGKVLLAAWHRAEVEDLVRRHRVDVVLADGFRLGAGLAAERLGLPWVAYTHHYFDEASTSEGMVEYYCQRFTATKSPKEVFCAFWPRLREQLGCGDERRGVDESCWWNLSPVATLVLGLPELKVHSAAAPGYVHRVGPSLWAAPGGPEPEWLAGLGQDRPGVLIALSTNPVPDSPLAERGAEAFLGGFDVVVTAGAKLLPDLPSGVIAAGDFPHSLLLGQVAAVVCSAGHGTVTRAACAGVGVLAVPQMGDQPLVAEAVARSGLGFSLAPNQVTVEGLRASLGELLASDPGGRHRLAAAAQTYAAAPRSADLVQALIGSS
jgi:UDP:flavonoid glycosyltransferase YjiC (YdhE family)